MRLIKLRKKVKREVSFVVGKAAALFGCDLKHPCVCERTCEFSTRGAQEAKKGREQIRRERGREGRGGRETEAHEMRRHDGGEWLK